MRKELLNRGGCTNMKKTVEHLNSTVELWEHICKTADFKSKEYDKELLADIKKELGFDKNTEICDGLISNNTTPEELLSTLIKLLKPFSVMMSDLLKMFEEAGAQFADGNIQIKFDFENAKKNFGLDLDHFRIYNEKVKKVICYELQLESSYPWEDFLGSIDKLFRSIGYNFDYNRRQIPDEIGQWLEEYYNIEINWPSHFPLPPQSGIEKIDRLIAEIWQIPRVACELYNKCYQPDLGRRKSLLEKEKNSNYEFYRCELECWLGKFVEHLYFLVYEIKKIIELQNDSTPKVKEIEDRLEAFRDRMPIVSVESERLVKEFLDLLNLPVWKKRYALYSAWVSTQIISAFDKRNVKYNVTDGILSFSFGGSVIAHIKHSSIEFTLFAELRTAFAGVKGRGRTHNIQPDYSLCLNDESDPKNTVLVVECKQYKKASKRNFIEAIVDYANGRPIAQIMLTNYTSIPNTIRSGLPSEVCDRVPFFDVLIPGDESCDLFKKAVKEALPKQYKVSLSWGKSPLDLDLMLIVTEPSGDKTDVYFSKKGSMQQFPYAYLVNDDRKGYGYEVINTLIFRSMKYDYYVHNYSGEKTDGDIKVDVTLNNTMGGVWIKTGSNLDTAKFWHVLTVDHCLFDIVDKMVPFPFTQKQID